MYFIFGLFLAFSHILAHADQPNLAQATCEEDRTKIQTLLAQGADPAEVAYVDCHFFSEGTAIIFQGRVSALRMALIRRIDDLTILYIDASARKRSLPRDFIHEATAIFLKQHRPFNSLAPILHKAIALGLDINFVPTSGDYVGKTALYLAFDWAPKLALSEIIGTFTSLKARLDLPKSDPALHHMFWWQFRYGIWFGLKEAKEEELAFKGLIEKLDSAFRSGLVHPESRNADGKSIADVLLDYSGTNSDPEYRRFRTLRFFLEKSVPVKAVESIYKTVFQFAISKSRTLDPLYNDGKFHELEHYGCNADVLRVLLKQWGPGDLVEKRTDPYAPTLLDPRSWYAEQTSLPVYSLPVEKHPWRDYAPLKYFVYVDSFSWSPFSTMSAFTQIASLNSDGTIMERRDGYGTRRVSANTQELLGCLKALLPYVRDINAEPTLAMAPAQFLPELKKGGADPSRQSSFFDFQKTLESPSYNPNAYTPAHYAYASPVSPMLLAALRCDEAYQAAYQAQFPDDQSSLNVLRIMPNPLFSNPDKFNALARNIGITDQASFLTSMREVIDHFDGKGLKEFSDLGRTAFLRREDKRGIARCDKLVR